MGQKKHPIIPGGAYQKGHPGGSGRGQSGSGNWGGGVAVKGASNQLASDGPSGKGYQTSAHTDTHHFGGEAVGHLSDIQPMHYSNTLHGEGNSEIHTDGQYGKAAHHPHMASDAHKFPMNQSGSGFGHTRSQMKGNLRNSGHPKAHRIGCK